MKRAFSTNDCFALISSYPELILKEIDLIFTLLLYLYTQNAWYKRTIQIAGKIVTFGARIRFIR